MSHRANFEPYAAPTLHSEEDAGVISQWEGAHKPSRTRRQRRQRQQTPGIARRTTARPACLQEHAAADVPAFMRDGAARQGLAVAEPSGCALAPSPASGR